MFVPLDVLYWNIHEMYIDVKSSSYINPAMQSVEGVLDEP
jgi:hypothetical protein